MTKHHGWALVCNGKVWPDTFGLTRVAAWEQAYPLLQHHDWMKPYLKQLNDGLKVAAAHGYKLEKVGYFLAVT